MIPTLTETTPPDDDQERIDCARLVASPLYQAARAMKAAEEGTRHASQLDVGVLTGALRTITSKINDGDLRHVENMLLTQATALQSLFTNLTERGMDQDLMPHLETFLRLALRAQAQSTRTLEVLATMKNPPPVIITKQANIAQQQQINNATAPAQQIERAQNKLLESLPSERLEFGAAATASGVHSELEALDAIHRPEN